MYFIYLDLVDLQVDLFQSELFRRMRNSLVLSRSGSQDVEIPRLASPIPR